MSYPRSEASKILDRRTRLIVASKVPCDERAVCNYLSPEHQVSITVEHHVARVLSEMGLPDPRASRGTL